LPVSFGNGSFLKRERMITSAPVAGVLHGLLKGRRGEISVSLTLAGGSGTGKDAYATFFCG
jgi:hypothetical protein